MTKPKKLPKRVLAVIDRARRGDILCRARRARANGDTETVYFWEPGGKDAPPKSAEAAIKTEFLIDNGDGLFPGTSQSWRAA